MKDLGYGLSEEMVPQIHIDGILEVKPPRNGEILFWKIRNLITVLAQLGLNIKWVSFDSYQSVDSMQLLRQQGFSTGRCSMDTSTEPYDLLKTVIYTGSLSAPTHDRCRKELISLEKIAKTGKIDHPPNGCHIGSTLVDCSDGVPRSFEELAADWELGLVHYGLSWDTEAKQHLVLPLLNPRITKETDELVEVELENGQVFVCTPDHPYLLASGEYVPAGDLLEGTELQD